MRCLLATVFALSISSALALQNADFNPINYSDKHGPTTSLNSTFSIFRWKGKEAYAKESFDVNIKTPVRIQVTDYKNRGDMFEVFDNGQSLGSTTKVDGKKDDDVFASTPEEALKDERFSKGVFDLDAGEHKITIKAVGPYEAGTAAIRILDHVNPAGFYKKGGHHDEEDEDDDKEWHKDDDDDDKEWHKDESEEKGDEDSWHKEIEHKNWKHKKNPTSEEIDFEHTITYTKTKWIVHKPTYISPL